MKFRSTLYTETYTEVELECESQEECDELVLSGDYEEDEIIDITVKESEII